MKMEEIRKMYRARREVAVALRFDEKLTYRKIGEHFGVTVERARQMVHKGTREHFGVTYERARQMVRETNRREV